MRTVVILGAMVLAVTSVQDAEARGRRGGSRGVGVGVGVGVGYSSSARSEESSARRGTIARATPVADPAFLRPILPVRVPVQEAAPPTRSASAGCASGRLVGQGTGFCQIN